MTINWYGRKIPHEGELIMVTVKKLVPNVGFYVTMDEYKGNEALLVISNVIRGRTRKAINCLLKINSKEVVIVSNVKGETIDVSLKDVSKQEKEDYLKFHNLSKQLLTSFKKFAYLSKMKLEDIYKDMVWQIFPKDEKSYLDIENHAYNFYKSKENIKHDVLLKLHHMIFSINIQSKSQPFLLVSYGLNGKENIKSIFADVLKDKKNYSKKELYKDPNLFNLKIRPTAIPTYNLVISSSSNSHNSNVMTSIFESIKKMASEGEELFTIK